MKLIDSPHLKVEKAVISDMLDHEGWKELVNDERAVIINARDKYKCVFRDVDVCKAYLKKYDVKGEACILGLPADGAELLSVHAYACKTYAYLSDMPPALDDGVTVKRLAPTLAETVYAAYSEHEHFSGYVVEDIDRIMRERGIFGAFRGSSFVGFIGRHGDGNMGILHVYEAFRRRGVGAALEKFMINYIMTFGRTPICDVYVDNVASVALQEKLGLTAADGFTFWTEIV